MKINFEVVNGNITIKDNSLALYNKLMSSYNNTGKELVMEVSEFSKQTTEKQISLYKALILHTVDVTGHTYKEIEAILLCNCSTPVYDKDIFGNTISNLKKVEDMNNKEFNIFLEQAISYINITFDADFKIETI